MDLLGIPPYAERRRDGFLGKYQCKLRRTLAEHDVDEALIEQVVNSGYFAWGIGRLGSTDVQPGVMDSYYGNKRAGLIGIEHFVEYLRSDVLDAMPPTFPEYRVKSISEVRAILSKPEHMRHAGRMSFRGQTTDYWVKRPIPNPRAKRADGYERMIVPSWWRKWIDKNPAERESTPYQSPLSSAMLSVPLLYHDIPHWQDHFPHNEKQDLNVGGPDCTVCTEMAARYEAYVFRAQSSNDVPLLEQHYGIPTIGLDVTFDPAVAFFFAANRFVSRPNGRASFEPVRVGKHQGVVYCFVFEWPSVRETEYLIRDIGLFKNIPPLRPIRQRCGLPAFHVHEISAAVRDLHAVFYLDEAFDPSELPSASYLFPSRDEDAFYGALLELRERAPEIWGAVVEYDDL
jgi:hypothetical protein